MSIQQKIKAAQKRVEAAEQRVTADSDQADGSDIGRQLKQQFSRFGNLGFKGQIRSAQGIEAYAFKPVYSNNGILSLDDLGDVVKACNLASRQIGDHVHFSLRYDPRAKHFVIRADIE